MLNKNKLQSETPRVCACAALGVLKNAMSDREFFKAKCFHVILENYIPVYVYAHTDTHTANGATCPHLLWCNSFWYHNWGHVIEGNHTSRNRWLRFRRFWKAWEKQKGELQAKDRNQLLREKSDDGFTWWTSTTQSLHNFRRGLH